MIKSTYLLTTLFAFLSQNPFDYIENNVISDNTIIRDNSSSLYQLLMYIGIVGLVISIMFCGLKIACIKNPSKRDEAKKEIFHKFIVGIILFGFVFFFGLLFPIIKQLI